MRRHHELAQEGASWLIVFAPDDDRASRVADIARAYGALMAEEYHRLVIENLI